MNTFFLLLTSIVCSFGLAVLLVEKRHDYPVRWINLNLRLGIREITSSYKFAKMLTCSICTAFWAAFIVDLIILIFGHNYFLWPISGFAASGFTWLVYQILDILESQEHPL